MKAAPTKFNVAVIAVFMAMALAVLSPGALAVEKVAVDSAAATKFIDALNDSAFKVLQSDSLSFQQKETEVRLILSNNFDLRLIGKFVLGASWRKASPDQRREYLILFKQYILKTYARRLGSYSGHKPEVIGAKPIGRKDVLVLTNIARPNATPLKAGWRVRQSKKGYRILDVIVAGISMVATHRSEFGSVVHSRGVGGLIDTLRIQVAQNSPK